MSLLPPPPTPEETLSWLQALRGTLYTVFAFVAGALGYSLREMDAGRQPTIGRGAVEAFSSGLAGLLTMLLCDSFSLSPQVTAVCVGVAGWLGAAATITVLQRAVWKYLRINRSDDNDPHP